MDVAVPGATDDGRTLAEYCVLAGRAVHLYDREANVVVDAIDRTLEPGRGHPTGPLAFGERFSPPGLLREKVRSDTFGKRTDEGIYRRENGRCLTPASPDPRARPRSVVPDGPEN